MEESRVLDEASSKRRRLDDCEVIADTCADTSHTFDESLGSRSSDAVKEEPVQAPDEDTTADEDVHTAASGDDEGWTLDRLMQMFDSAEEMKKYIERNQDVELLRFLAKLQGGRMERFSARKKLTHVNDIHDVHSLLQRCQKILVLTGAGVSVSAGIPDFRSANGIYARLKNEYDMPSPTCMFDKSYFSENPGPFFDFAYELWPGRFNPTPSHLFIAELEKQGKLLRNYTQNIDTLEQKAGIKRVIACHGSFATATCVTCKKKVDGAALEKDIMEKRISRCRTCGMCDSDGTGSFGVMKPDIVFFGESLPDIFYSSLEADLPQADLMLVIGTSLRVAPVSEILPQLPRHVPVVLINREVVGYPHDFDVELLGDSDSVLEHLTALSRSDVRAADANDGSSSVSAPHPSTELDEASEIVKNGGVVKWLRRPSTFLFRGFLPPPASRVPSPAPSSRADLSGDDDGMSSEGGLRSSHLNDKPGVDSNADSDLDDGEATLADPNQGIDRPRPGPSHSANDAGAIEEEDARDLGVLQSDQPVLRPPAKPLPGALLDDGYDESWGVQRPRPHISIMRR